MAGQSGIQRLGFATTAAELAATGHACVRVASSSMRPLIWPRAVAHLVNRRADELAVGDPVVFVRGDGSVCLHRVIGRQGRVLITRGDANARSDEPLPPERVLGTVEGVVVGAWQWRAAPRWLQRAARRGLLPALPALRWALPHAGRAWRAARQRLQHGDVLGREPSP
jgi:signal peptidase I